MSLAKNKDSPVESVPTGLLFCTCSSTRNVIKTRPSRSDDPSGIGEDWGSSFATLCCRPVLASLADIGSTNSHSSGNSHYRSSSEDSTRTDSDRNDPSPAYCTRHPKHDRTHVVGLFGPGPPSPRHRRTSQRRIQAPTTNDESLRFPPPVSANKDLRHLKGDARRIPRVVHRQ